jgi:hypothetical protein
MNETPQLDLTPIYVATGVLFALTATWGFIDGRSRGKSGVLVALLVVMVPFPLGPLFWVMLRPKIKNED